MMGMDAGKDFYKVLGVSPEATHDEIKRTFRDLAKRYHPDRAPGDKKAEKRFKEINEAYSVIGDPEKRRRYDRLRALGVGYSPDIEYGYDLNDLKEQLSAQMSGVKEFFSGIFDWRSKGAEKPTEEAPEGAAAEGKGTPGRDLTYKVSISLEKAMQGGKATFSVPALRGSERRRLTVDVPAGLADGKKIRLEGQGQPGRHGGPAGDLYLKVHILPDGDFRMEDGQLVCHRDLDLRTLMLGGEVAVPTPGGEARSLQVPPLTAPGARLELAGAGPGGRGLVVEVGLTMPSSLDAEAEQRFREFCEAAGIGSDS